jgi:hypothetical protein
MSDLAILAAFRLQLNCNTNCCRDMFFKELHGEEAVVQEKELIISNDA